MQIVPLMLGVCYACDSNSKPHTYAHVMLFEFFIHLSTISNAQQSNICMETRSLDQEIKNLHEDGMVWSLGKKPMSDISTKVEWHGLHLGDKNTHWGVQNWLQHE